MTSSRLHADQTHSDGTPCESMVTLPAHDACQSHTKRPHAWRTISQSPGSIDLACDNCGARTNNAFLADIHPCPGEETTRIILPGPLAEPVPRVLSRKAEDTAYMAPEVIRKRFANRLREAGYQEPELQVASTYLNQTSKSPVLGNPKSVPWSTVIVWSVIIGGVIGAVTWAVMR